MKRLLLPFIIAPIVFLVSCETPPSAEPVPAARPSGTFNRKYVGKPLQEASELAERRGVPWRVVEIDGVPQMTTKDYRPNRLNFSVKRGFVVEVSRG